MDIDLIKGAITDLSALLEKINEVNTLARDLGCVDGTIIGTGRSDYTQDSTMYNLSIKNKDFALIDIPGIEGDESAFENTIKQSLEQAHLIFYVNGSGKKIEKESLQKIKKYMHDGTSVYAIFNVHCKAKKERIPGVDKDYSEELEEAYRRQESIVNQTREELVPFLGKNYRGSISMNGLLAFCSLAFDGDYTTIKQEKDKSLRKDQEKYSKEYHGNKQRMLEDSRMYELLETIEKKGYSFESDIVEENLKKLKNRMREMLSKVTALKTMERKKIDGFISICNDFEDNCYNAKEDFIRTMRHVASNAAEEAFYDLMDELFDRVEKDGGKVNPIDIQMIVEMRKNQVISNIQSGVNNKIEKAQESFKKSIEDAQERMKKDFGREQIKFEISLSSESVALSAKFADVLKYNLKDFGHHAITVGGLAIDGALVGSVIGNVVGAVIGAAVGSALGVLISMWNYFASEKKRINRAKAKLRQAIDKQIEDISEQINSELRKIPYEQTVNNIYNSLYDHTEKQKKNLMDVRHLLGDVERELILVYKSIA